VLLTLLQSQRLRKPRAGLNRSGLAVLSRYRAGIFGIVASVCGDAYRMQSIPRVRPSVLTCTAGSLLVASMTAAQPAPVTYHLETQPRTGAELAKQFTPAQLDILEMLRRSKAQRSVKSQ
jgi:hypothetical protein